jgi:hypothetical protein
VCPSQTHTHEKHTKTHTEKHTKTHLFVVPLAALSQS